MLKARACYLQDVWMCARSERLLPVAVQLRFRFAPSSFFLTLPTSTAIPSQPDALEHGRATALCPEHVNVNRALAGTWLFPSRHTVQTENTWSPGSHWPWVKPFISLRTVLTSFFFGRNPSNPLAFLRACFQNLAPLCSFLLFFPPSCSRRQI